MWCLKHIKALFNVVRIVVGLMAAKTLFPVPGLVWGEVDPPVMVVGGPGGTSAGGSRGWLRGGGGWDIGGGPWVGQCWGGLTEGGGPPGGGGG